jgi:hypothetical protein
LVDLEQFIRRGTALADLHFRSVVSPLGLPEAAAAGRLAQPTLGTAAPYAETYSGKMLTKRSLEMDECPECPERSELPAVSGGAALGPLGWSIWVWLSICYLLLFASMGLTVIGFFSRC